MSPFPHTRERRVLRINARYEAFLAAGFPLADYPGETLQCRNELDRTNWLALKDICDEALAAELGDELIPAPGIRTTANTFIRPTYAATWAIMRDLRAWVLAAQANWWRLKDDARTLPTREAVEALDLEAGWP